MSIGGSKGASDFKATRQKLAIVLKNALKKFLIMAVLFKPYYALYFEWLC